MSSNVLTIFIIAILLVAYLAWKIFAEVGVRSTIKKTLLWAILLLVALVFIALGLFALPVPQWRTGELPVPPYPW